MSPRGKDCQSRPTPQPVVGERGLQVDVEADPEVVGPLGDRDFDAVVRFMIGVRGAGDA